MSETNRRDKQGESKDKKNDRMTEQAVDERQGADRPDVHNEKQGGDEFDATLERDSKQSKRGSSSEKPLTGQ